MITNISITIAFISVVIAVFLIRLLHDTFNRHKTQIRQLELEVEHLKDVVRTGSKFSMSVDDRVDELKKETKHLENECANLRWHIDNLNRLYNIYKPILPKYTVTDSGELYNNELSSKTCKLCGGKLELQEDRIYTSIPPKYGYKCTKCGNIQYSSIKET